MADKKGRNKKRCEQYKLHGRREINKKLKQERAVKREERFRQRREEGKAYEYKPNPYDKNSKDKKERRKYWKEHRRRSRKNVDRRLPLQKFTSIMRKCQNKLDRQKAEERKLLSLLLGDES